LGQPDYWCLLGGGATAYLVYLHQGGHNYPLVATTRGGKQVQANRQGPTAQKGGGNDIGRGAKE